jgi:hypothetical protein
VGIGYKRLHFLLSSGLCIRETDWSETTDLQIESRRVAVTRLRNFELRLRPRNQKKRTLFPERQPLNCCISLNRPIGYSVCSTARPLRVRPVVVVDLGSFGSVPRIIQNGPFHDPQLFLRCARTPSHSFMRAMIARSAAAVASLQALSRCPANVISISCAHGPWLSPSSSIWRSR